MKYFFSVLLLVILLGCGSQVPKDPCLKIRAAFDVGSGTTKMKVAKVNLCERKLIEYVLEENIPVEYKQNLKENDGTFTKAMMDQGVEALKTLKQKAEAVGATSFIAAATSAFRTSKNGTNLAKRINDDLAIDLTVISQKQEAMLGYRGVLAKVNPENLSNVLVWDIGGGSMQMTYSKDNKEFEIYEGKLASVSFKNMVIEKIQKKNPKKVNTPNPIGKKKYWNAVNLAMSKAKKTVNKKLQTVLKKAKTIVYGIGGVHNYSVKKQVRGDQTYTYTSLMQWGPRRAKLTDKQIGTKYAPTDVTNLALVQGFMKAFGVKVIYPVKVNMADGLLISQDL